MTHLLRACCLASGRLAALFPGRSLGCLVPQFVADLLCGPADIVYQGLHALIVHVVGGTGDTDGRPDLATGKIRAAISVSVLWIGRRFFPKIAA